MTETQEESTAWRALQVAAGPAWPGAQAEAERRWLLAQIRARYAPRLAPVAKADVIRGVAEDIRAGEARPIRG